jgi:hypothetical protein
MYKSTTPVKLAPDILAHAASSGSVQTRAQLPHPLSVCLHFLLSILLNLLCLLLDLLRVTLHDCPHVLEGTACGAGHLLVIHEDAARLGHAHEEEAEVNTSQTVRASSA